MSEDPIAPARSIDEIFAPIGGEPNSCTHAEYHALARHVRGLTPCRFLVFGVGRDSVAWQEVNAGCTTLFLENNPEWIAKIAAEIGPEHIRSVDYQQRYEEWEAAAFASGALLLPLLENPPFDRSWDVVFVDAPWGPTFGRHQSTHAATHALAPGGLIALHDCERDREQAVCRHILEARGFTLAEEIERLRIYRAPDST